MEKPPTSVKAEAGRRILRYGVALAALVVFAYLCWRASPWLHQVPWMPEWLGRWGDRHGNFRNMPAFGGLALVLIWALGWRCGVLISAVAAVGLELPQLWIATRGFDWADIGWSLVGVGAAAGLAGWWRAWRSSPNS